MNIPKTLSLFILLVVVNGASQSSNLTEISKYFPLKVGNSWVYNKHKDSVINNSRKNIYTILRKVPELYEFEMYYQIKPDGVWEVGGNNRLEAHLGLLDPNKIYNQDGTYSFKNPKQILKYPFVKGQRWFLDNRKKEIATIEDFCVLQVQAGSFQNVLKIKKVYNPETISQENLKLGLLETATYTYYAPGVGNIKAVFVDEDNNATTLLSLVRFVITDKTIAKKNASIDPSLGVGYGAGYGGGSIDDIIGGLMGDGPALKKRGTIQNNKQQATNSENLAEGRSNASITRVVMQNNTTLRYSYNKRLREKPGLNGKIKVKFVVDEFGSVISCQIVESTMGDPTLEKEIVGKISLWKFGKIDKPGDAKEVIYPFIFSQ